MTSGRLFVARLAILVALFMSLYSALLISTRNSVRTGITSFSDLRPYLCNLSDMRLENSRRTRRRFQSNGISFSKRRMSSNSVRQTSNRMKTITVGVNERNNQPREVDENNEYIPYVAPEPLVLTLSGRKRTNILIVLSCSRLLRSTLLKTVITERTFLRSHLKAELHDSLDMHPVDRFLRTLFHLLNLITKKDSILVLGVQ